MPGGTAAGGLPPQRRTNVLAVVSLVLSLVSFCILPIIGAVAGIVCGHLAKRQIRETGEEGNGLATAGIVLGWVHIGLVVLGTAAAIALAIAGAAFLENNPSGPATPFESTPSIELPTPQPS
jgi:hypothetical protein